MNEKYISEERTGIKPKDVGKKVMKVCKSYEEWMRESKNAIELFEAGEAAPFHISFDDTNAKYRSVCRISGKDKDESGNVQSVSMRAGRGKLEWAPDIYEVIKTHKEAQVFSWALQSALTSFDDALTKPEAKGRVSKVEVENMTEHRVKIAGIQAMLKNNIDPLIVYPADAELIAMVKDQLTKNA
jgi:hypothetical protein